MKYNIGDKVRVRKDLIVGNFYGDVAFSDEMVNTKGKIHTVEGYSEGGYCLNTKSNWIFTDGMLEEYDDENDLLELALRKLNMTKKELKYELTNYRNIIDRIMDKCDSFDSYCNGRYCICENCKVKEFKIKNNIDGARCSYVYEVLKDEGMI